MQQGTSTVFTMKRMSPELMLKSKMAKIYGKLKTLASRIFSLEKKFGYNSSVANLIFMFYCIMGKIYVTDKIQPWVKYLWFVLVSIEITFAYTIGLAFLWHSEHFDVMVMHEIGTAVGAHTVTVFGYPMITYFFGDKMDAMIELVDEIVSSPKFDKSPLMANLGLVFGYILAPIFFCFVGVYSWVCFIDVVFFFEEEKVKNYLYYMYSIPLIREYGSLRYYLVFNGFSTLIFEFAMIQLMASLAIILLWNEVCLNELIDIRNEFHSETSHLNRRVKAQAMYKFSKALQKDFENVIRSGIARFQKITLLINYMRGYVQVIGTFVVPVTFGYCVAVLYFGTSETLPFALKMKFLACFIADLLTIYIFYSSGQNLENMIFEVSVAVYSTPWYCSTPAIRTNLYVLLCQTQTMRNFTIIKVYGLLLRNYSRFVHAVLTYTNFLRKLNKN